MSLKWIVEQTCSLAHQNKTKQLPLNMVKQKNLAYQRGVDNHGAVLLEWHASGFGESLWI